MGLEAAAQVLARHDTLFSVFWQPLVSYACPGWRTVRMASRNTAALRMGNLASAVACR